MIKEFLIVFLSIFILSICEFITYDGKNFISLFYSVNTNYNAKTVVSMDNFNEEMISYYSWFASYGYCKVDTIPYSCCKNDYDFFNVEWQILSQSALDNYYNYNYVLWRNDKYKKYIMAFPGTRNIITELVSEIVNSKLVNYNEEEDNGIKVVSYFKNVAFELINTIFTQNILDDIKDHPTYQFISIGHSLGASVASLVLYEAVNKDYIDTKLNDPVLIAFGMPRTGNENFVLDFTSKIKNIFRVVMDGDIVVDIPYSPINNPYRHLGGLILINKDRNSMNYCPKDIGEDYPDKECKKSKSINYNYHLYYFNPDTMLGKRCVY